MTAAIDTRKLVDIMKNANFSVLVTLAGLAAAVQAGYSLCQIDVGKAAKTQQNYAVVVSLLVAACVGVGVGAAAKSDAKEPTPTPEQARTSLYVQQEALAALSSNCLRDPVALDLLGRLSSRIYAGDPPPVAVGQPREVHEILQELERRLRYEAVTSIADKGIAMSFEKSVVKGA